MRDRPPLSNGKDPIAEFDSETWRIALESAGVGVWDADLVRERCVYSPSWKQMLGYGAEELEDDPELWLRFLHPDDRDRAIESGERYIEGRTERIDTEFRLRHRDGHWIWVLDRGRAITWDENGRPTRMIGVQTEITRQKQAEHDLAMMNERVRLALDVGGVGLWSFESETGRVRWDQRLRQIYGIGPGPEEVPRDTWHRRLHPQDAEEIGRLTGLTEINGEPLKLSYRIVTPAGEVRHLLTLTRLVGTDGMAPILVGSVWDVTEQVQGGMALAAEKERLRTTLHSIADAVVSTDVDGRILFVNPAAERLLQPAESSIVGEPLSAVCDVVDETTGKALELSTAAAIRHARTMERREDAAIVRPDGTRRSIRDVASPIYGPDGALAGAVLVLQDVTEARLARREVEHAATHDALTGLLNRAAFEAMLVRAIAQTSGEAALALVYIDLDRLKVVNDTAGHGAGDALLKLAARAMRRLLPAGAAIARMGGDEFAAAFGVEARDEAVEAASGFVKGLQDETLLWENRSYRLHASVGVTMVDSPHLSTEKALAQADAACLAAKHSGRNRYAAYVEGLGAAQRNISEIKAASELNEALAQGRLRLFGQEIRDLDHPEEPFQIEILCRMLGPNDTIILPGTFIPAAERFGLMDMLDRWIIENTVRGLGAAAGLRGGFTVALNLSAQSLGNPDLWLFICGVCASSGVSVERLAFEITETAAIGNFEAAEDFVRKARLAGCRIGLDDFGSGLSSFGYLKRFAIDHIKIDGSFIDGLVDDPFNRAVVASISRLARELKVDVVAERIEDAEAVAVLRSLGVRYGQGFLFGRPEPLDDWLSRASDRAPPAVAARSVGRAVRKARS